MKLSPRRTVYLVGDPAAAEGFAVVAGATGAFAVVTGPAGALAVVAGPAFAVVAAFAVVVVAVAVLLPPTGITRRRPATIRWGLASAFALARAVALTR